MLSPVPHLFWGRNKKNVSTFWMEKRLILELCGSPVLQVDGDSAVTLFFNAPALARRCNIGVP